MQEHLAAHNLAVLRDLEARCGQDPMRSGAVPRETVASAFDAFAETRNPPTDGRGTQRPRFLMHSLRPAIPQPTAALPSPGEMLSADPARLGPRGAERRSRPAVTATAGGARLDWEQRRF